VSSLFVIVIRSISLTRKKGKRDVRYHGAAEGRGEGEVIQGAKKNYTPHVSLLHYAKKKKLKNEKTSAKLKGRERECVVGNQQHRWEKQASC